MSKAAAINKLNETELRLGIAGTSGSWHQHYVASKTIYIGGLATTHTEKHILSIFEQYGTLTHVNLIRDPHTNQSKQFAFANYADARSAVLAVDNLNSIQIDGTTLTVDHVQDYRMPNPPEAFDTTPITTPGTAVADTHSGTPTDDSSAFPHNFGQAAREPEVERKRQLAVMERLENLRKRRRIEANNSEDQNQIRPQQQRQPNQPRRLFDSQRMNDSNDSDQITPASHSADQPHTASRLEEEEDSITPRQVPSDSNHSHSHDRAHIPRDERRRLKMEKERRKAQRAAIRQARAERRANRERQNR